MKKIAVSMFVATMLFSNVVNAEMTKKLIEYKYHHLGVEKHSAYYMEYPEGSSWKKTFKLPSLTSINVYLEFDGIIRSGGTLILNGRKIALPMTLDNPSGLHKEDHQTAIMALPSFFFQVGSNTLELQSMSTPHGELDFELGRLYIYYK